MRTAFIYLFVLLVNASLFAQPFEGKCVYQVSFKSKVSAYTDQQLSASLGNRQDYYIKGASYKALPNGQFVEWQLYKNTENKLYVKMVGSDTIFWSAAGVNTDSVLSARINKSAATILGYKCDELVLDCISGVQKYYFNAKLGIPPELYKNHHFGNWYEYVKRARALPLKMIIENAQFIMESKAIEVKAMKIPAGEFRIPAGAPTRQSPY